jgi:acetolactate synthase-1/3 small subunit
MIARELMLVRIRVDPAKRSEVMGMAEAFRCSVVDVGSDSLIIQIVGDADKNHAFIQLLAPYGILELVRTGETAMSRGN